VPLVRLLGPMFELARQRTAAGGDAAAENRAALLVLTLFANGRGMDALVPAAAKWPRPRRMRVMLGGREDLPLHFLVSAALAAEGSGPLSQAIGLYKEVTDSRGGSGFSFSDMAANRAGTRFGQNLVGEAARVQALLAPGADGPGARARRPARFHARAGFRAPLWRRGRAGLRRPSWPRSTVAWLGGYRCCAERAPGPAPAVISKRSSRHSIGPFHSGTRRLSFSRIRLGSLGSGLSSQAVQPRSAASSGRPGAEKLGRAAAAFKTFSRAVRAALALGRDAFAIGRVHDQRATLGRRQALQRVDGLELDGLLHTGPRGVAGGEVGHAKAHVAGKDGHGGRMHAALAARCRSRQAAAKGLKGSMRSKAKRRIEPGAMPQAICAASMTMVPAPQQGSSSGPSSARPCQPAAASMAAARVSFSGASPLSSRQPRLNSGFARGVGIQRGMVRADEQRDGQVGRARVDAGPFARSVRAACRTPRP
jgi:hypothetical protein